MARVPYFCSGCPHNSSTKVPDGSMAMAGIGCHTLAIGMERNTKTFTHMGAEGATWVGASHFTDMPHVFQNLGDGTYFHSGYLAIRHAVATKTTITYKILYNDAVAMTGGQPHDGNVHAVDDQPAGPRRGRAPHRPGERRSGQISGRHRMGAGRHLPSPRPARRGAARAARGARASRS